MNTTHPIFDLKIATFDWVKDEVTGDLDYVEVERTPDHGTTEDGDLWVSGEDGLGFVDFYGEFRGGYPYIDPAIIEWATEHGGHFEWRDPGSIVFYAD